jgi:hypothetical protein
MSVNGSTRRLELAAHLTERFQQAVVAQPHEDRMSLVKLLLMKITCPHYIAVIKLLQGYRARAAASIPGSQRLPVSIPVVMSEADCKNFCAKLQAKRFGVYHHSRIRGRNLPEDLGKMLAVRIPLGLQKLHWWQVL